MHTSVRFAHLVLLFTLLALVGCSAAAPSPVASPAPVTAVARAVATGAPAIATSVPPSPAPSATPSATPTVTDTPLPTLTPTPSATPTIVQGVKDTNVLVNVTLVQVIDGNTLEVKAGGKNYRVRYLGIQAPAAGTTPEPYAAESAAGNKKLVTGQALRLEKDVTDTDAQGRLLRYVYTKTYMVNAEMVRFGYARALPQAPDTRYKDLFAAMESEARGAKRGLWNLPGNLPAATVTPQLTATPEATLPVIASPAIAAATGVSGAVVTPAATQRP